MDLQNIILFFISFFVIRFVFFTNRDNGNKYIKQEKNGLSLTKAGERKQIENFCNSPMGQHYIKNIIPQKLKEAKRKRSLKN